MTEVPPGWVKVEIGKVCEVVSGGTPKTTVPTYWGKGVAWVTPSDLSTHDSVYINCGARSLTQEGYKSCSAKLMPAGSILFTSRAPIGYVAIASSTLSTNQGFKSFVPPRGVVSKYIYWYLHYATPMIRNMGSGTTFTEVSKKIASTIPLLLPPEPEQRRIVTRVEEILTRLDKIQSTLESLVEKFSACRSSILAEVFCAYRNLPSTWIKSPLKGLLTHTIGGIWGSEVGFGEIDVDVIRVTELRPNGRLSMNTQARRSITNNQLTSRLLRDGDIILEKSGGGPTTPVGTRCDHRRTKREVRMHQLYATDAS